MSELNDTFPELVPGTRVGEYVLEGRLAHGGMATIYAAYHPVIGKRAAVKVLNDGAGHARGGTERLICEACAVNRIHHPSVVDVFACGQLDDGRGYLVMELLEGETLAQRLRRFRLSNEEIYEILIQLSDVLDTAHARGIAHLDLKPENIFLVNVHGGRTLVKLLDFGLADLIHNHAPHGEAPHPRVFRGTPEYASPEQAEGRTVIDHRSDIYSMGVVAYELFTGTRPFRGSVLQLLHRQVHDVPAPPSQLCLSITPQAESLVMAMLGKVPAERPSAAEVRERLLAFRITSLRCTTQPMPALEDPPDRWRTLRTAALAVLTLGTCLLAWRYDWSAIAQNVSIVGTHGLSTLRGGW